MNLTTIYFQNGCDFEFNLINYFINNPKTKKLNSLHMINIMFGIVIGKKILSIMGKYMGIQILLLVDTGETKDITMTTQIYLN